jgi:hypothetical protein
MFVKPVKGHPHFNFYTLRLEKKHFSSPFFSIKNEI